MMISALLVSLLSLNSPIQEGFAVTDLRNSPGYELAEEPVTCVMPESAEGVFWFGEKDVQPGERLELEPKWITGPGVIEVGSSDCIEGVKLSPNAPAVVTEAGGNVLVLAGAEHGATFEIVAQVSGKWVEAPVRVLDPARNPLAGRWVETSKVCQGIDVGALTGKENAKPVRELDFNGDGSYSVTFEYPFESYRDYWGRYDFDLSSRHLTLAVADGNQLPGPHFKGNGRFRLSDDSLILSGIHLGLSEKEEGAETCEYVFHPLVAAPLEFD